MWIKRKWLVCGALRRDVEAKTRREQEKCDKVTMKCRPAFLGPCFVVHINVSTMVPSSIRYFQVDSCDARASEIFYGFGSRVHGIMNSVTHTANILSV